MEKFENYQVLSKEMEWCIQEFLGGKIKRTFENNELISYTIELNMDIGDSKSTFSLDIVQTWLTEKITPYLWMVFGAAWEKAQKQSWWVSFTYFLMNYSNGGYQHIQPNTFVKLLFKFHNKHVKE